MGNANSPSGGSGDTQYQWQYKTTESWVDIGSANSATYDPSTIFITTQYQRGARRSGCSNYVFTTSITKAVDNQIIASNTTSTNSIIEGQTKNLTGTPSGGSWSLVSGGGSISSSTYTPDGINTDTTVVIRYTIAADGDCVATFDDFTFTVKSFPNATVTNTNVTCYGLDNGSITFTFPDNLGRSNIKFSLDGGLTYQPSISDASGSITYSNLEPGTHDVWTRWGNDDYPQDLGSIVISEPVAVVSNITTNASSITEGQTKQFNATPSGGAWNVASGSGSIDNNGLYTPININTNTNITVRYIVGCGNSTDDVTFTVTPVCAVANNTTSSDDITVDETKTLTGTSSFVGEWSIVSGGGSIIENIYTPATISGNNVIYATANENQNLVLQAPVGSVINSVTFASYGTPTGSNGNYTISNCHAANSLSIVESYAIGKNSVTIPATNTVFGDPCSGTSKRLFVKATYISTNINTNTSVTIRYTIAADGSCEATSDDVTFTVTPVVVSWDGSVDGNWLNVNNWSTNILPTSNAVVLIPGGLDKYPTVTGPVSVNAVIMASGSSLIAEDTFIGALTYNRTLSDDWHLIASPVVGETIENMHLKNNFIEAGNGDIGLAPYQHDDNTWGFYKNTSTGVIVSGQGYSSKLAILGDVSFTGTMATTNIDITSFGRTIDYNLVGNPYPSYINIESFLNENSNSLEEKTLWMDRFDILEGKRVYKPISFTSNLKHIAPTQGFFVQPKESTVLSFTESMQSHQPVDTFEKTSSSERPEIKLLMTNGISTKYTDIFYIEGTTTGFDNGYDSSIFNSTASFSLYTNTITNSSGRKLAIQSLPNSDYESMVVPFGITADADKEITFSATAINLPAGIKVYLEDRELNVFTELVTSDTDVYKVDLAAAVNGVGRFYLHTSQKVLDVSDVPILTNIKIYKTTNTNLRIVGLPEGAKALKLYNIIGQEIMSTSFNTNGVKDISLPNLSKGVYTVQLKIGSKIIREKIFLE